jgi:hypothetical protein
LTLWKQAHQGVDDTMIKVVVSLISDLHSRGAVLIRSRRSSAVLMESA